MLKVHPHACGELIKTAPLTSQCVGSSPRMWGTQDRLDYLRGRRRFIPTHVGNSSVFTRPESALYGSSPRMWGTLSCRSFRNGDFPVHPHACGELMLICMFIIMIIGSSPRMWGTPWSLWRTRPLIRFIPTHVGNSFPQCPFFLSLPVHPHACGELVINRLKGWEGGGSSPRMWGTPFQRPNSSRLSRFIPTHVGNSGIRPAEFWDLTVHPHACGELTFLFGLCRFRRGSSPRMWGTRSGIRSGIRSGRFIPTHVGNSN